jgi:hypothetical protein
MYIGMLLIRCVQFWFILFLFCFQKIKFYLHLRHVTLCIVETNRKYPSLFVLNELQFFSILICIIYEYWLSSVM